MLIRKITYGSRQLNKLLDDTLMVKNQFPSETLMEIAGIAVSQVADLILKQNYKQSICVLVGPGNNGGDGLVAARHLKMIGYNVSVVTFKKLQGKNGIYQQLCSLNNITCQNISQFMVGQQQSWRKKFRNYLENYRLIIDGIFGFPFTGEIRSPYNHFIPILSEYEKNILSIDIPSGWDANEGNIHKIFCPNYLISLGIPKKCCENFKGDHYYGGRFIPNKIAEELGITLPQFKGCELFMKL